MSKSVNKVILIGNVGKDPDVKYTPSGVAVAKFSLATNERYKDKSGQWQDRTEWHNMIAWQRLAEIVGEYVHQGSRLYVEGRLQTSSWEDKGAGEKKYRTEIVIRDITLLGGREQRDEVDRGPLSGSNGHHRSGQRDQDQRVVADDGEEFTETRSLTDDDIPF